MGEEDDQGEEEVDLPRDTASVLHADGEASRLRAEKRGATRCSKSCLRRATNKKKTNQKPTKKTNQKKPTTERFQKINELKTNGPHFYVARRLWQRMRSRAKTGLCKWDGAPPEVA